MAFNDVTKNRGPLLSSFINGGIDSFPNDWLARVGYRRDDQEVPLSAVGDTVSGQVVASQLIQTRTDERKQTDFTLNPPPVGGYPPMVTQERLPNGQIGTRTRKLVNEGAALVLTDDIIEGEQKNFGVGGMEQNVLSAPLPSSTIHQTEFDNLATLVDTGKTRKLISAITEGETVVSGLRKRITKIGETATVAQEVVVSDPIPGVLVTSYGVDPDGTIVTITKQRKLLTNIVEGETVTAGIWKKTTAEGDSALVAVEVVESRPIPCPTVTSYKVEPDGMVVTIKETRKLTSSIVEGESVSGTIWRITYGKGDGDLVTTEVVEERTVPGPTILSFKVEPDGTIVTVEETRKFTANIIEGETLVSGLWKVIYSKGDGDIVTTEVVEKRTVPCPSVKTTRVEQDGLITTITKTRKATSSILPKEEIVSGFWRKVYGEGDGDLVTTEVVESRPMPGTAIPSGSVDGDQMVVTISKVLKAASTVTPSSTVSGTTITTVEKKEVTELVSEEITSNRTFLDKKAYTVAIENPLPQQFQVFFPTKEEVHVVAGTAALPSLDIAAGEMEESEQQLDRLLKKTILKKFTEPTLPFAINDREILLEYGGVLLNVERKFDVAGATTINIPATQVADFSTIRAKTTRHGRYGQRELATTLTPYPTLKGTDIDEEHNIAIPYTQKVVEAGTEGSVSNAATQSIKPLDAARSLSIIRARPDVSNFVLVMGGTTSIDFPPQLVALSGVPAVSATAAGAYGQNGTYTIVNAGNGAIHLEGEAHGSASVMFDVIPQIKQTWAQNIPCYHALFFILGPVASYANVWGRCKNLMGDNAIAPWPTFKPQSIQLTCIGKKTAGTCRADIQHHDSITADYLGRPVRGGSGRTTGAGLSLDNEVTIKSVTIPPTIHPAIAVTGQTANTQSFSASAGLSTNLAIKSAAVSGSVAGGIVPTSLPATAGVNSIPTVGRFIRSMKVEPWKWGWFKCDVEVVNAVDWS